MCTIEYHNAQLAKYEVYCEQLRVRDTALQNTLQVKNAELIRLHGEGAEMSTMVSVHVDTINSLGSELHTSQTTVIKQEANLEVVMRQLDEARQQLTDEKLRPSTKIPIHIIHLETMDDIVQFVIAARNKNIHLMDVMGKAGFTTLEAYEKSYNLMRTTLTEHTRSLRRIDVVTMEECETVLTKKQSQLDSTTKSYKSLLVEFDKLVKYQTLYITLRETLDNHLKAYGVETLYDYDTQHTLKVQDLTAALYKYKKTNSQRIEAAIQSTLATVNQKQSTDMQQLRDELARQTVIITKLKAQVVGQEQEQEQITIPKRRRRSCTYLPKKRRKRSSATKKCDECGKNRMCNYLYGHEHGVQTCDHSVCSHCLSMCPVCDVEYSEAFSVQRY